jgi:hypothetical protein
MAVKAELRVVLMAGEHIVAESDDPTLWQEVLARLYGSFDPARAIPLQEVIGAVPGIDRASSNDASIEDFASAIGVTSEELIGACRPRRDPPHLVLDHHCWESYKAGTPARGRGAVGATAVVGTLLAMWSRAADLPESKFDDAAQVLRKLGVRDSAPRRTVKNCEWLQSDGDRIKLNPARITRAQKLARAFVKRDWASHPNQNDPD